MARAASLSTLTESRSRASPRATAARSAVLGQGGRNAATAILRAHGDILELRGVGQSEVGVAQRLIVLPRDQIVAITLLSRARPSTATTRSTSFDANSRICHMDEA